MVKRFLLFVIVLVLAASAQAAEVYRWGSVTGNKAIAPSNYVGPGDVVSGATAYYGLRAYNRAAAVAGTNAAIIKNTTTAETCNTPLGINGGLSGVVAGCSGSSSGDTIAVFCALSGGPCTVAQLYDQTGNGNGVSRGQSALQPALSLSCLNGLPCLQSQLSTSLGLASSGNVQTPAAASVVYTAARTGNNTSLNYVFCDCSNTTGDIIVGFGTSANSGYAFAGTAATISAVNDNSTHAVAVTFVGSGSSFCADGICTAISPGTNTPDEPLRVGYRALGCTCNIFEAGLWPVQFSGAQIASMCANQYNYWGTAAACTPAAPASLLLENGLDNLLLESGSPNVLCLEGAC